MLRHRHCRGISLIEVLIVIGIIGLLLSLLTPAVQYAREAGRRTQCSSNLRQLSLALLHYHDAHRRLPPAVVWSPAGEPLGQGFAPPGTIDRVSLGMATGQQPDRVFGNWLVALLPQVEEQALYARYDAKVPLAATQNAAVRNADVSLFKCPTDPFSGADNPFRRAGVAIAGQDYARGNYAMNGGTNDRCLMRLSSEWPPGTCTDGFQVDGTDLATNTSQVWGAGIGGVNRSFGLNEFANGMSKTVAIEEIRAGVHSLDRRGVWALGFVGSSATAAHGRKGNKGPNAGNDAIQGCAAMKASGADPLAADLPCSGTDPTREISEQATSRSMHSAGVNLSMCDGSVHFVANAIDATLWDRMHRRDNREPLELPFE